MDATFARLGDAGVVVRSPLSLALHADLTRAPLVGVIESVPALNVLTVLYDPLRLHPADLEAHLRARLVRLTPRERGPGRVVELPVTYDGPDLAEVARLAGLSVAEVVALHAGAAYEVAFLGFLPGFAYLTGLPDALRLPRRGDPRERVAAGSVAIGGPWSGVYPLASPGGWHLLGRTNARLFDPRAGEPILLRPGDRLKFVEEGA